MAWKGARRAVASAREVVSLTRGREGRGRVEGRGVTAAAPLIPNTGCVCLLTQDPEQPDAQQTQNKKTGGNSHPSALRCSCSKEGEEKQERVEEEEEVLHSVMRIKGLAEGRGWRRGGRGLTLK